MLLIIFMTNIIIMSCSPSKGGELVGYFYKTYCTYLNISNS